MTGSIDFRVATEAWEFEQIHALNHRTFVEEIPQHEPRPEGRLIDRFHHQNTYIVAMRGRELVGMVALRGERPFSLDGKLDDLDRLLPPHRSPCEVRLLAVVPGQRKTAVFGGILKRVVELGLARGHDLALISGTTRQTRLYRHLGFTPFGPLVGTSRAPYQPMYLELRKARELMARSPLFRRTRRK